MAEEMKLTKKLMISVFALLVVILVYFMTLGPTTLSPAWRVVLSKDFIQIKGSISAYKTEYGKMPSVAGNARLVKMLTGDNPHKVQFMNVESEQLELNPAGELVDPWETPFRFLVVGEVFHVISAGPDKIFGTADDIAN